MGTQEEIVKKIIENDANYILVVKGNQSQLLEYELRFIKQITTRYYISSLKNNASYFQYAIRSHWAIENKSHWILDVGFSKMLIEKEQEMLLKIILYY